MSMDAGGLAHMSYNSNNLQAGGGIGVPTAGFASRGKGAALKRLSVASPPKVAPIAENSLDGPTPRTSRSHLLAGLRTAPKTPTSAQPPASAPYNQRQHNVGGGGGGSGLDANRYARQGYNGNGQGPQTATGAGFPQTNQYGQPITYDQVLAPPSIQYDDAEMDPNVAAQLLATELYLAQRQQQLQQQLLNLTAQSLAGMSLNGGVPQPQGFTHMNAYGQASHNAPYIQETGQPGVYLSVNPATGQYQYVMDPNVAQQAMDQAQAAQAQAQAAASGLSHSPPPPTPRRFTSSPPKSATPALQVSPPNEINPSPWGVRSSSPPKKSSTPPQDIVPLPPPSANAFRRGHKKNMSSLATDLKPDADGPKSAMVRPVGMPATPLTGTFGPGQARAGEHPMRQPRGPPPLEELQASPTSKHEGSKNFAARQRRQAVNNLVRAGIGRRVPRTGSAGSMTPVSENEMTFPSDNDTESVRSSGSGGSSLSARPSIGSLRAVANGAIGSERKASRDRSEQSRDRSPADESYTADSLSSEENAAVGGGLVEIRTETPQPTERRRTPKLVLTSAEKRKTMNSMF